MLKRTIFCTSALSAILCFNGTAMAQEPSLDCEGAKQYLVQQYSRSDPANNEKYYNIWSSPQCVQARKNAELSVDPGIKSNEQLIRSRSQDYDTRLAKIPALCEPIVEKRWSGASEKFRAEQQKSELLTSCIRNQSHALRAEYLNRVNEQSEAQYAEKLKLNQQKIAADQKADADRQAAYEIKMDEWRDAVKRCNAGEIRYCSLRF
tara:strand:+ start:706 stop:1323 length:618 start_codon:yes stop_codon:yes gene_type:complete